MEADVVNVLMLIGMAIAGGLLLVVLDALVRRPIAATRLVLAVVVLGTLIEDSMLISVEISGFRITPEDVAFALITGAAVVRFFRVKRTSPQQKALITVGAMLLVSLLLGVAGFGLAPAVNEFRTYLSFVGVALYFSTINMNVETRKAMSREWVWAGVILGGMVILRWASRFGGFGLGVFDGTAERTLRVVNGPNTLTIAAIALILILPGFSQGTLRGDRHRQVGAALLFIAVMLNRRTLWLALAVVLVVLILRDPRVGRRLTTFAATGLVLFAIAVPLLGGQDSDSAAISAADADNLVWRVEGWKGLLESGPDQLSEYLIGLPFGSGYEREVRGTELVAHSPHNYYLQAYLRTGAIGIAALLLALLLTATALAQRTPGDDVHPFARDHLLLLIVLLGVWLLTWSPLAEQGILLGLAIASVSHQRYRDSYVMADSQDRVQPIS